MPMTLRLTDEGETRLTRLSDTYRKSKTAVIEDALSKLDAETDRRARVQAAFAHVEQEDAELLARLADR